jgi:hypothetical protein
VAAPKPSGHYKYVLVRDGTRLIIEITCLICGAQTDGNAMEVEQWKTPSLRRLRGGGRLAPLILGAMWAHALNFSKPRR